MNIIKLILLGLGLIFGAMVVFWLLGVVYSLIWYLFWIGVVGAIGYGGYKMFQKAEARALGGNASDELGGVREYDMSWEEYDRKHLPK